MRILSGIQPSGTLHIGNYFGMMRPCLELQHQGEAYLFIADLHALTQLPEPKTFRERSHAVAVDFLACGLDPTKTIFFRQSDIPEVLELTWLLSCLTPVGLLERCHSFKDKIAQGIAPNHGLFSYPVLMAADILIYQSNLVPVGKDQKQHLEVTRDLAQRFNNQYGPLLTIPECLIRDAVAIVPGVDGEKMSKSYNNTIEIFEEPKSVRKKAMRIVTDCRPMEEPKIPETDHLFQLYSLFADDAGREAMAARYRAGGFGYGEVKKALADAAEGYFAEARARRQELAAHPQRVREILGDGAQRARARAQQTLRRAQEACGVKARS